MPRRPTNVATEMHYSAANSLCPPNATTVQEPRTPSRGILSRWASGLPSTNLRLLPASFTKGRARGAKPRLYPRQPIVKLSGFLIPLYRIPRKSCQYTGRSAKPLAALQLLFEVQPTSFRKPLRSQHLGAVSIRFHWQAGCTITDRRRKGVCDQSHHGVR
jgi:hypothetical protein